MCIKCVYVMRYDVGGSMETAAAAAAAAAELCQTCGSGTAALPPPLSLSLDAKQFVELSCCVFWRGDGVTLSLWRAKEFIVVASLVPIIN